MSMKSKMRRTTSCQKVDDFTKWICLRLRTCQETCDVYIFNQVHFAERAESKMQATKLTEKDSIVTTVCILL